MPAYPILSMTYTQVGAEGYAAGNPCEGSLGSERGGLREHGRHYNSYAPPA